MKISTQGATSIKAWLLTAGTKPAVLSRITLTQPAAGTSSFRMRVSARARAAVARARSRTVTVRVAATDLEGRTTVGERTVTLR